MGFPCKHLGLQIAHTNVLQWYHTRNSKAQDSEQIFNVTSSFLGFELPYLCGSRHLTQFRLSLFLTGKT